VALNLSKEFFMMGEKAVTNFSVVFWRKYCVAASFCHTKSYNIITLVRNNDTHLPQKKISCPLFEKNV
jgi:hypothetical protein